MRERDGAIKPQSLMLVRNGQENAIVHSYRAGKEGGSVPPRDSDVAGITAESWPRGI